MGTGHTEGTGTREWPHVVVMDPYTAGLAIARRMVRLGAQVTVVSDPLDLFVDRTRGVHSVVEPFSPDAWLGALRETAERTEEVVAIPATDRSCELLLQAADSLPANIAMFERSGHGHMALMDKQTADGIAREAGVPVPWTAMVGDSRELAQASEQAPWPCVVKPVLSHEWRARYSGERVFVVQDAAEAQQRLARPLGDGVGMMLSQYIRGGDDAVEEAIVVRLADGSYPVQFGCHKLRQNPRGFGSTSVGRSSTLPETSALARKVLDAAGFVGVAGVETKRDVLTGERWFLEVNVRVPGQWGLGDSCGAEATQRLVTALSGCPLGPAPSIREGVGLLLPELDAPMVAAALREVPGWRRPLVAAQLMRIYAGARNLGVLDLRDPGPGLAWLRLLARRRTQSLRRLASPRKAEDTV